MKDNPVILVLCTCPPSMQMRELATQLLQEKLAACVNILPGLTSIYTWKEAICEESETLLLIKSTQNVYPLLEAFIRKQHPFDVPEIIAVSVVDGFRPYLNWISEQID